MSMRFNVDRYLSVIYNPRMAIMVLLGFSSGLPLPLTGASLQAWLTVTGVDLKTIGLFSIVGLPYTIKFLWAPLMDRFASPWLGRRRGWILLTQIALFFGTLAMAFLDPGNTPVLLGFLALLLAFLSASQDIVIDAFRTDTLAAEERGLGSAVFVLGYRIALLFSGAIALILADRFGWQVTYIIMAFFIFIGIAGTLRGKEPVSAVQAPKTLTEAVTGPLVDFFTHNRAIALLSLIVLYKLGDVYAGALSTTFLLRGIGFSQTDVGTINKAMGLTATIVGGLFGGLAMVKLGLYRALLYFGILQMVSNLSFVILAWIGKSYTAMATAVALENVTGGMGTTAFVALLMTLCNQRYSATQFALLSSLSALGRVLISPTSGYIVEAIGWANFFLFSTIAALPGLVILLWLRSLVTGLEKTEQ